MLFNRVILYVCHDDQCHRLVPGLSNAPVTVEEMTELSCDHKEANTRMLLHASHAFQSYENVLIKTPDTDVFIISLYFCLNFSCRLFFETGVKDKARVINVNRVVEQIGENKYKSFIGFHVLNLQVSNH